jgi:oxygen-dependent protoporphyrinogen oxidase
MQDGFTLECGPNVFVEKPALMRLIGALDGLAVRYPSVSPYQQLLWNGERPVAAPKGPVAFLKSPLFTLGEKVRIIKGMLQRGLLQPKTDDMSVADFFTPLLGGRAVRAVLDPALKGIYGGDVADLSARSLFPALWQAACEGCSLRQYLAHKERRGKIFVLAGGAETLVTALLNTLPASVLQITSVGGISQNADGIWRIECEDGSILSARNVCVTTAGPASAPFLRDVDAALSAQLAHVNFASLSVVHCSVPIEHLRWKNSFGMVFPAGVDHSVLGIMFNSALFPHVAPSDSALLTVCLGGAASAGSPVHEQRETYARAAISKYLGIAQPKILHSHTWARAIPQLAVGHYRLVEHMRQVEERQQGIFFCGTDTGGVGVPDRVEIAESVATRILQ